MHARHKQPASVEPRFNDQPMETGRRRGQQQANSELQHVFKRKCNTAAAAKERERAWEEIAARVNA